jgi:hypothetical protein
MPKSAQGRTVARHGVVEVVTVEDLSEPSADLRNRFVHPALQRLLDLLQFRSHPFARRLAGLGKHSIQALSVQVGIA